MPGVLDGQPALYRALLPDLSAREIPAETKAACSTCPMADPARTGPRFRADTKCCTYHPKLPNYLVGGLLADGDPAWDEGRRRIRDKIRRRVGATPQWITAPPRYDLLYRSSRDAFGRSAALRCPYYLEERGQCSIWPWREAVCATWHCRHVAGADGQAFWMALKRLLSLLEIQLSRYALLRLFPDAVLRPPDPPGGPPVGPGDLDDQDGDELAHLEAWGDWHGREEELYIRCHEVVQALTPDDLPRILGIDAEIHGGVLERLRQAVVSPALPARPRLNPQLSVVHRADGTVGVGYHSEYDALALPAEAWRLLSEVRGQESLEGVRRRLRETFRADLDDAVWLELHRHRILI